MVGQKVSLFITVITVSIENHFHNFWHIMYYRKLATGAHISSSPVE